MISKKNQELARIFKEISVYLQMEDAFFRSLAYEKAAFLLESMAEGIDVFYEREGIAGFEAMEGIGKNISQRIEEYLKTGRVVYYEKLKKAMPVNLEELLPVEGLGPKRIKDLYLLLKIKTLADLEKAAKEGKISKLPGFGKTSENNLLEAIAFLKKSSGRFLLGDILPDAERIIEELARVKGLEKISFAGSLRRMKETIGDVDILAVSADSEKIMDRFASLGEVKKVWAKGATKTSVRFEKGFDVDLRVVPEESYGSALQYFTGSKDHNILLRKIAMAKGLKLNEYGLFKGRRRLVVKSEEEIYKALGLNWVPPELREGGDEIERNSSLPKLIELRDIKADLHCHSDWNGGENSISELVAKAKSLGYEYLGISDHTKFLKIEKGLDEKKLLKQNKAIKEIKNFKVLHGCEANIMADGSLDISSKVLDQLDYVIAGVHSQLKMPKEEMTRRIIKAMENPSVDIISHPTGRLLAKRDEYELDFDAILEKAKETGTILEINSSPERLDLNSQNIKKAKLRGVKMIINTDVHRLDHFDLMRYGVGQARRGWLEKEDVINCLSLEEFLNSLKTKTLS